MCPGGYGCDTHTTERGYCKNGKYIKLKLEATSGTMIKTNARDVCNHCMNKRRRKEARDNCASALLELTKEAYDIESIKKCVSALSSFVDEKKGEEPKKDGKRKVKSRRKSKSRRKTKSRRRKSKK